MPELYHQVLDNEISELVYTFAFATTKAKCINEPDSIARKQVPSRDMECTITKEYLTDRLAVITEYFGLPRIDMTYMNVQEELLHPAA